VRRRIAPKGEKIVVYTGSCLDWHGIDVFADVAARWKGPEILFVVVGDGPARPRLEKLASERGVSHRFAFVGKVSHEEVGPHIAAADACIAPYAPSRHPIFRKYGMTRDPIKVLEYMALAKPTLTIDTPRMRELFHDGEDAILYPAEDAEGLRGALEELFSEPARAARIAEAGRQLVLREHTWDRHAEELGAIFQEVVA
jgi:glycosyltransferase involved in cell wall biosynthesis